MNRRWFTKDRVIIYGTLTFFITLFTVYAGGKVVVSDMTAKIKASDSSMFVQWHTPCDKVRIVKEYKTDIRLLKIDCKLDQLLTESKLQKANEQFKKDSLRYLDGR